MVYVGSSWVELDYWTSPSWGSYDARLRVLAYSTQDISTNTSRIYFKLQKRVTGGSAYNYDPLDFRITGTGAGSDGHSASQEWVFGSVSDTSWVDVGGDTSDMYWSAVKHRADGTLSLTANATGDRILGGSFDSDISISLPTIARASSPTVSPNPITIKNATNTLTVNTNRKASSFTHTVKLQVGTWSLQNTGVGASTTFNIPYSVIAQFSATSKTANGTITCTTYNGSTNIGTKTTSVTLQVDAATDHANIGTITITDTNPDTSAIISAGQAVYGASNIEATIPLTVSGSYTELASAKVTCGTTTQNYTLSGTSQTITFTKNKVDVSSLTVTVTDKRGNSVTDTASWQLLPYQPLTLTGTVGRPSATGSVATGQVTGTAYGGTYGSTANSLNISYEWKLHSDTNYTAGADTYTQTIADGQQNYSEAMTFAESFDYQNQYDIRFTVSDLFSTSVYVCQLMQGLPILSWDETEVDVFGNLHIHDRDNPTSWQDVIQGFDAVLENYGQKNLLPVTKVTATVSGVTFTVNTDGSIKANGTATATAYFSLGNFQTENGTEYILNGCPSGGGSHEYDIAINSLGVDHGNGITFTGDGSAHEVSIMVFNGITVNNLVFYPMIRDSRIASDEFVPYAPQMEWNYKTFNNTSAGVTSGSVRWVVIGRVCFANFYDVQLTNVSHPTNSQMCSGLPPAKTAMLFLISAFGTGYSAMRMRIDTDGGVYFHYAGTSLATQHYGQVFYIVK